MRGDLRRRMNTQSKNSSSSAPSALASQVKALYSSVSKLQSQLNAMKRTPVPSRDRYYHEREEGLKDMYAEYRDNILADYIYGLYHPDVVFKESLDIKSPSYMPVPTTSFKFKETFTISPNRRGNFVIYWSPNFLGTSDELTRIHKPEGIQANEYITGFPLCYVNSSANLDGNSELLNEWYGINFKHVRQDFEKYRLTSACIKVKYTGKVLNQSGILAAAASYTRSFRTTLSVPVTDQLPSSFQMPLQATRELSQFCDFDNIRQGQWAETCSIVSDPEGLTCTYVPTDPLNQVFVDNATTIDAINHNVIWDGSRFISMWQPTNANISYAICGYGINPDEVASCITVEAYYNYEIIVRQEQYPYFSPRVSDTKLLSHKTSVSRILDGISSSGLIKHTTTHDNRSVWTKVRGAFAKAAQIGADVWPYVKPFIASLA